MTYKTTNINSADLIDKYLKQQQQGKKMASTHREIKQKEIENTFNKFFNPQSQRKMNLRNKKGQIMTKYDINVSDIISTPKSPKTGLQSPNRKTDTTAEFKGAQAENEDFTSVTKDKPSTKN